MIPFIRSLSELKAISESRDYLKQISVEANMHSTTMDSGQRKRYIKSINENAINLPNIPNKKRNRWRKNKESLSKLLDKLDYNNQIQSSYDITLLEKQKNCTEMDVA